MEDRVPLADLHDLCAALSVCDSEEGDAMLELWEWTPEVQIRLLRIAAAQAFAAQTYFKDDTTKKRVAAFLARLQAKGTRRSYAFRTLRTPLGRPLSVLKAPDGNLTANPNEIDAVAQAAMQHVYSLKKVLSWTSDGWTTYLLPLAQSC